MDISDIVNTHRSVWYAQRTSSPNVYQKWTAILSSQKNVIEILKRFPWSAYLQIEQRRMEDKTTNRGSVLESQRNKSIATRKAHAIVRKSALEQIKKDKLTLTKVQRKRFDMDKIEDNSLAQIKANREFKVEESKNRSRKRCLNWAI